MPDYTVISKTNADNSTFTVLAPAGAIEDNTSSAQPAASVIILFDWSYAVGSKPVIKTAVSTLGAKGSKIVVQVIAATSTDPRTFRCILLEGSSGATVKLNDDSDSRDMVEADFVDVVDDPNGAFLGSGGTFDGDNTEGSEGLMGAITAAKSATGVS